MKIFDDSVFLTMVFQVVLPQFSSFWDFMGLKVRAQPANSLSPAAR
jgi:hypothetical protein